MKKLGELFVVATPIGNLQDITLRALNVLKQVDVIAAEDTRHSGVLLQHYGINTRTISLHDYNETKKSESILRELHQGKNVALVSDAGTPLISDPGYHLIRIVKENGFKIVPVPGACAAISALSVSGLPTNKFIFEGFLPAKEKQRVECLQNLSQEKRTMIFYESSHRIMDTIKNMQEIFGVRRYVVIAKELTKTFETIFGGAISEVYAWLAKQRERQKGEFVILVRGAEEVQAIDQEVTRIFDLLVENMSHKQAVILTSKITGINKNRLYKVFL